MTYDVGITGVRFILDLASALAIAYFTLSLLVMFLIDFYLSSALDIWCICYYPTLNTV